MPVFAISGLPTCGSSTAGRLIAKKLHLDFFSAGDYYKTFSKGNDTQKAISFMKTKRGFGKSLNNYIEKLQEERAAKGNVVIEAKIALWKLKDTADFKIWLEAPIDVRVARITKRDKIPFKQAKKDLQLREKLERKKFKSVYGFDSFEQKKYADIVVNTGNKTPEQIVKLIIDAYRKRKLTIAVSGLPCAGSTTVGDLLAKKMKMKSFSPGNVFKGHKKTSMAALMTWSKKGSKKSYHEWLDAMQERLAKHGNIVINGKLSVHKLHDLTDFSVWLYAKKEIRVARLMKRDKMRREEASKIINERESIERKKWKTFYGFDYFAQRKEADLSIDTSNKTPEQVIQLILKEMKKRKIIL